MVHFVDRENEIQTLSAEYHNPGSALVIVYGRRRIGKTSLIREFIKDKPAVYYLATEESEAQNRGAFKNITADFTGNGLLKNAQVEEWAPIFDALVSFETGKKKIIVIDEFQYLGQSNPAFPSIMQKIWDTQLMDRNIMLILCGSFISMMESQTLSYESPLYGRRTAQIKLKQIPFHYYHEFFPDRTKYELVQFYALTGGIPKYIELFHAQKDIYRAIGREVLSPNSFLYDEPYFLLHREVSQIGSYFSIIKTIAAGNRKMADIAASLGQKQTGLTRYLNILINLDILEREVPVTEEHPEKSKRGLYRIKDNFLLFWFKFVYPNISYIESGNQELVIKRIRQNFIDSHVSYMYEAVCREELRRLTGAGEKERKLFRRRFYCDKTGSWWNGRYEIGLLAFDSVGRDIIFGECKYRKEAAGTDVLYGLEMKALAVDWKRETRRNHYVIFSINGFSEELLRLAEKREDLALLQ
jgi:AAA+ ATPase superfamily predicted ATPase